MMRNKEKLALPVPVARLYSAANYSIAFFICCQILGLIVIVPMFLNYLDLLNQVISGNPEIDLDSLTLDQKSDFQYLVSGISMSGVAGMWLPIAFFGRRLRRPYSHSAYKFLITFAILDLIIYLLSLVNMVVANGNVLGAIGTTLAFGASMPVVVLALKPEIRKWSSIYSPPPPEI